MWFPKAEEDIGVHAAPHQWKCEYKLITPWSQYRCLHNTHTRESCTDKRFKRRNDTNASVPIKLWVNKIIKRRVPISVAVYCSEYFTKMYSHSIHLCQQPTANDFVCQRTAFARSLCDFFFRILFIYVLFCVCQFVDLSQGGFLPSLFYGRSFGAKNRTFSRTQRS